MQCVKPYNEKWLRSFIDKWDKAPRGKIYQLIKIESSKSETNSTHHLFIKSINWGTYYKVTLTEITYNFEVSPFERVDNPDSVLNKT